MKKVVIGLLVIAIAVGISIYVFRQRQETPLPPDMEIATDVRAAVKGKSPDDVSKITIEVFIPDPDAVVITNMKDISDLFAGLQEAVRTKIRYACAGPRISVYWKGKAKPSYFYICTMHGAKGAYGVKFYTAYNRVAKKKDKTWQYEDSGDATGK